MKRCFSTCAAIALTWLVALAASDVPEAHAISVRTVTASSTMPADGTHRYDASHLVDGDPRTWWQPGGRTPYFAWIRFDLQEPSLVDGLVIHNGNQFEATSGELFAATGRVRSAWVLFDDGSAEVIRLDPHRHGPRRVILARYYSTRSVTLVVRDFEIGERWNHLALSEVRFTGRTAHDATPITVPAGPAECGTPGWVQLRDAVVAHCGDPRHGATCADPVLDVVLRCRSDANAPLEPIDWSRRGPRGGISWSYTGRWFAVAIDLVPAGADRWRVADLTLTDVTVTAN